MRGSRHEPARGGTADAVERIVNLCRTRSAAAPAARTCPSARSTARSAAARSRRAAMHSPIIRSTLNHSTRHTFSHARGALSGGLRVGALVGGCNLQGPSRVEVSTPRTKAGCVARITWYPRGGVPPVFRWRFHGPRPVSSMRRAGIAVSLRGPSRGRTPSASPQGSAPHVSSQ